MSEVHTIVHAGTAYVSMADLAAALDELVEKYDPVLSYQAGARDATSGIADRLRVLELHAYRAQRK